MFKIQKLVAQDILFQQLANGAPPGSLQQVLIGEFIPISYYNPPNIIPESPQSSPPATLPQISANPQVHQVNIPIPVSSFNFLIDFHCLLV